MDDDVKTRFASLVALAKQVDEEMGPPPPVDEDSNANRFFAILRRPSPQAPRNAHLLPEYDEGEPIPETKCMRWGCSENRWKHPSAGPLVLCRDHGREVAEGRAKAPPIRQRIDYQAIGRRTLLVEFPTDDDKRR